MRVLLDTNALLFVLAGGQRFRPATRRHLTERVEAGFVSEISLWEVATKRAAGKGAIGVTDALDALEPSRLALLPLRVAHVLAYQSLPWRTDHRDPFDRMIVAQAQAEGLTLVTSDRALAAYGVPVLPA
ncbi:MAG: type II toxin-antitoxin system VapC family toxin [Rubritepida sp.]|jgi:PIN domain nuclease of toxin-antitoxin system|nr:type II toxin-antitoxin system VapC family toxin [Rubritepida sp.]